MPRPIEQETPLQEKMMAYNTINALQKILHRLKTEKENAFDRVCVLEKKYLDQKTLYDHQNAEVLVLQKRIVQIQNELSLTHVQLKETNDRLDTSTKQLAVAESEVTVLTKKARALEEDVEQTTTRLLHTSDKLEQASQASDESERGTKVLESRNVIDEERIHQLEKELEMTVLFGEEADHKFEQTAHRLAMVEVDVERTDVMCESAEAKITELEEQLKVVSSNRKSLEIAEQEAAIREDQYERSILLLSEKLKIAEDRATGAEQTVNKLQKEVDRLEGELAGEKDKCRLVANELDLTFTELTGY